jgi:HD-GYP domain-containing protein (c-di-GMP phosphodiesterase class II)
MTSDLPYRRAMAHDDAARRARPRNRDAVRPRVVAALLGRVAGEALSAPAR